MWSVLLQLIQSGSDSGNDKAGKSTVFSLNRKFDLLHNIRRETDGFVDSGWVLRDFKFCQKQHLALQKYCL